MHDTPGGSAHPAGGDRFRYVLTALLSASLIALEIAWTRIFSAEFFYTYAFLILSLAVLGLGLGGLALRLVPRLAQGDRLPGLFLMTGFLALLGPSAVLHLGLDFGKLFASWRMAALFAGTVLLLASAFFTGGMALALLFRRNHGEMPRLYRADLVGAGAGVAGAVLLMNAVGTPKAMLLLALPLAAGAFLAGRVPAKALAAALGALALGLLPLAEPLLDLPRKEPAPVIYTHWDAMAKVKVYDYGKEAYGLNIDNAANSPVYRFDGNWDRPAEERIEFGIPVGWLIGRMPSCVFLSLGAGGGTDVLQALQEGATEVHAVEVNGHINRMMTRGFLRDFTGRLYLDPRVVVATEDARAYVRRHPGRFDLIYSLSSNTFAALASGSFAMAENYLFTVEAFRDYWRALSDRGVLSMEHQFYMPRLAGEALAALRELGVPRPERHLAVYDLPKMRRNLLLLSKRPLDDEVRANAYGPLTDERWDDIHLLYPPSEKVSDNLIARIVERGWEAEQASAPVNLEPCRDDRPYTGQLGRWDKFSWKALGELKPYEFRGFPLARVLILGILGILALLILPFNLLPFARRGPKLAWRGWLYFFLIGAAYMAVEVVLIQRYTRFIGPSAAAVAAILFSLLLASGAGSRFAPRVGERRAFAGLLGFLLLELAAAPAIVSALAAWPMGLRIAATVLLLLPLGFFMGMPFPSGTARVGALVDWGFAVNGMASVAGSACALLVAFSFGFRAALGMAALLYLASWGLTWGRAAWVREPDRAAAPTESAPAPAE